MELADPDLASAWALLQSRLEAEGLGDGLPLGLPSTSALEDMLRSNRLDADTPVACLAPMQATATWRDIAYNALLAGCRAPDLPIVGAAVAAVAQPEFNLLSVQSTTGSAATLVIVNGPAALRAGMNCGTNALGPGNRANATIGRALRLVLQNIGGARSGETDMATLGQPAKYTFCMAENEAESPWEGLHRDAGFGAGDSTVTVLATAGICEVVDAVSNQPEDIFLTYAGSMLSAGHVSTAGIFGNGRPLLVIPPEHARFFSQAGYTKGDVKSALMQAASLPLDRLSPSMRSRIERHRADKGDHGSSGPVRLALNATDIMIAVAGGVGVKAAYIPGWSASLPVTRRIDYFGNGNGPT